jgi:hypothetical protein
MKMGNPGDGTSIQINGIPVVLNNLKSGDELHFDGKFWRNYPAAPSFATPNTFTPNDPAGTSSATAVMMGLGSTVNFTPKTYGSVMLTLDGLMTNASDNMYLTIAYGTGAAPVNGAAASGTAVGSTLYYYGGTAFSKAVIITGLTPGTAYWFDAQVRVAAIGTAVLQALTATVQELIR